MVSSESDAAEPRRIAVSYELALKALGIDAVPLKPDATEGEVIRETIRRASVMLTMALTDLYLTEVRLRGTRPPEGLIEQFAKEVPRALEHQVANRYGTPVEKLLKAMLKATRK